MNKEFKFKQRIVSDTFLEKIKEESIRNEIKSIIFESYKQRIEKRMTQNEYAKLKELNLITLKRIELGQCYNLILISKYIK